MCDFCIEKEFLRAKNNRRSQKEKNSFNYISKANIHENNTKLCSGQKKKQNICYKLLIFNKYSEDK